jgi:parvulin-like peptidyl-prolyl isomerase
VNRRLLALLVPLAVVPLAGCTTFSDNDAAARVDDAELTEEMLEELVPLIGSSQGADTADQPAAGDSVRNALTFWIRTQLVDQLVGSEDIEITDAQRDDATQQATGAVPGFAELSSGSQELVVGYLAANSALQGIEAPAEDEIAAFYEAGMEASGIACVSHILVETEEEARDVLEELADGADFPTLALERSLDTGSAQQGGVLPCTATSSLSTTYVAPFADAAIDAEIGVPTEPVETEFGFHIIRVRTVDEVRAELGDYFASAEFAITATVADADIYVDPRYGTVDRLGVVVALG